VRRESVTGITGSVTGGQKIPLRQKVQRGKKNKKAPEVLSIQPMGQEESPELLRMMGEVKDAGEIRDLTYVGGGGADLYFRQGHAEGPTGRKGTMGREEAVKPMETVRGGLKNKVKKVRICRSRGGEKKVPKENRPDGKPDRGEKKTASKRAPTRKEALVRERSVKGAPRRFKGIWVSP